MPQKDKYRTRIVQIEFETDEKFKTIPMEDRASLVFVTNGTADVMINKKTWNLSAPCILCLSQYDEVSLLNSHQFSAKSFSFIPTFLNTSLTFEALEENKFTHMEDEHDRNMMMMFVKHSDKFGGIIPISSSMYLMIEEWMKVIGTEIYAQSDGMWTCRIRRYLLQTLYLIHDNYLEMAKCDFDDEAKHQKDYVEIALEYIHTNYQNSITMENICKIVNLNRTSLNMRFKEKTGNTAMDYLISYRIKIACEALVHTNLKIKEIAESCGFKGDSYFIKQFSKKQGVSPLTYRHNAWERRR